MATRTRHGSPAAAGRPRGDQQPAHGRAGHAAQDRSCRGSETAQPCRNGTVLGEGRQRRVQDHARQLAGGPRRVDRPIRRQHRGQVRIEGVDVGRQAVLRHAEQAPDRQRLGVETSAPFAGEWLQPGVHGRQRRVDERGVDPQREVRVTRRIRPAEPRGGRHVPHRSRHGAVEPVQAPDLGPCGGSRPVDDAQVAAQRPDEPAPRVCAEVGVLVDALGDQGMRQLEQQRAGSGPEQQRGLAVQPPGFGAGPVEPGQVRGRGQRSLGRRPTTHQAAGNTTAAASSFRTSSATNGSTPFSIAWAGDRPATTANQGTPSA
jgi:hypothetical protein